jgi:hypothetical protein
VQAVTLATTYGAILIQLGHQQQKLVAVETLADTTHLMIVLMIMLLKLTHIQMESVHFVTILVHTAVNIHHIHLMINNTLDGMYVTTVTLTIEIEQVKITLM